MAVVIASYCPLLDGDPSDRLRKRKRSPEPLQSLQSGTESVEVSNLTQGYYTHAHLSREHERDSKKLFQCPQEGCTAVYSKKSRLEAHQRSHTDARPFSCNFMSSITGSPCTKTFRRNEHLKRHIKSAHTNERDYKCNWPGCGKAFVTTARLNRHIEAHEGQERYRCRQWAGCDRSFRKHSTLQRHIKVDHLGEKPYPCEQIVGDRQCDAAFDTTKALNAHKASVHGDGPRYWCDICTNIGQDNDFGHNVTTVKGFHSYAELQNHLRVVHAPVCHACGIMFSTKKAVRAHMEIHHGIDDVNDNNLSYQKPTISCPSCGKLFTKRGNMKVHVRSAHMNARPFRCGVTDLTGSRGIADWKNVGACGKSFTSKQSLENHVRSRHIDVANSKHDCDDTESSQQVDTLATAAFGANALLEKTSSFVKRTCFSSYGPSAGAVDTVEPPLFEDGAGFTEGTESPFWMGGYSPAAQVSIAHNELCFSNSLEQCLDDSLAELADYYVDPQLDDSCAGK